jgi:purine-binding chemotaxis protein CheW
MVEANWGEFEDEADRGRAYVVFRLGGEGYALEVNRVREVLDVAKLTAVPGGPPALRGVLNLRGKVVPVWDLRVTFGLAIGPPTTGHDACVLMVDSSPDGSGDFRASGLLVERVSDVIDFPPEDIQPSPQIGLGLVTPYVRGLIRHRESFLLVLDVDLVFATLLGASASLLALED